MVLGTLLLVLMTAWNGRPLPAGVPTEALPLVAFVVMVGFVYALPLWLLLKEREYGRARQERSGFLGYGVAAASIALLWGTVGFVPTLFR